MLRCRKGHATKPRNFGGFFIQACVSYDWSFGGADLFCDLDVGACIFQENMPIETVNTLFESTQNNNMRIKSPAQRWGGEGGGGDVW